MIYSTRWFIDSSGCVKSVPFDPSITAPTYDNIVDKTHYRPDSELVRTSSISGSGLGQKGVFDDGDTLPSNLEVEIRSGKYDKAEVSQLLKQKTSEAEKSAMERFEAEKSADRQDKIDSVLGLKDSE